ncbi:MAG: DUF86 domain-containing protein [Bacteroidales bacterium]|nr:DUF86 domain-containing protein [Bacteroidales bacterium]
MEFTSSNKKQRVLGILEQIQTAISQLKEWNADIKQADDYYLSPDGMQKLAASCMLIEAIGEGIHQIDDITEGKMFPERPEIPWEDVIGIRNHIAHGYFDIDGEVVYSVIKQDLNPLHEAIEYFVEALRA